MSFSCETHSKSFCLLLLYLISHMRIPSKTFRPHTTLATPATPSPYCLRHPFTLLFTSYSFVLHLKSIRTPTPSPPLATPASRRAHADRRGRRLRRAAVALRVRARGGRGGAGLGAGRSRNLGYCTVLYLLDPIFGDECSQCVTFKTIVYHW